MMVRPVADRAHDVLGYERRPLDAIFRPNTVAVVGASGRAGSVGRTLMWNLITNPFGGTVFPVNPERQSVLGVKAYPSVGEIPGEVDLAVIATPAPTVPEVIRECVEAGVKGAIIISAGFRESGPEGEELERRVMEEARGGDMRILGPNCLGVMSPHAGLNATFAKGMARPGSVGILSQSGALLTAILDRSGGENLGFSQFVSVGSMMDVSWGDLIYYLGDDPRTRSIVIYMESIGDARSFLSAAREVALTKPIIVIKPGRTEAAGRAASSHTGALTGSDEVLDAAFRRVGVLRVRTISEMFDMAEILGKQPRPRGPNLTILTNAGGPGVLATDALVEEGGQLAGVSEDTMGELEGFLPGPWSHANPVDILGDADPERYAGALEAVGEDPASDGVLVALTPQDMTSPTETARRVAQKADEINKPVLASWVGGPEVQEGVSELNRASIPTFDYPDEAARAFAAMWRYSYNLDSIYETPEFADGTGDKDRATGILEAVRQDGRTLLTEYESKRLLETYSIPTVETRRADGPEEAVEQAEELGHPVVVKLDSRTITHKTDVGGVRLGLKDGEAVRAAFEGIREVVPEADFDGVTVQPMASLEGYELIVGSSPDPQFGPVLLFGSGGSLVEVYRDRALELPPLTTTLARRMMERTRIYEALKGVRGRTPVDTAGLERLLVRFSRLVSEQPEIKELDINPLLASEGRLMALDARVVLHGEGEEPTEPAIRPYPSHYVWEEELADGTGVGLRPIRPEDEPAMIAFHQSLSEESVYMRYFHTINLSRRVAHERLRRICFIDYDREMALIAERGGEILGVGRLSRVHSRPQEAEYSLLVADPYQGKGLGTLLLEKLVEVARQEGIDRITAEMISDNRPVQEISRRIGFTLSRDREEPTVMHAQMNLNGKV